MSQNFPGVPGGGESLYEPGNTALEPDGSLDVGVVVVLLLLAATAGAVLIRSLRN